MSKPAHERLKDQVKLLRSRAKLDTMTSEHEAQDHRDWLLADTLDAIADEVGKLEDLVRYAWDNYVPDDDRGDEARAVLEGENDD